MARPPSLVSPAADSAALLRRVGFAILFVALPVAGLAFRRGVVVLLPVGVVLIVIAAALDGALRPPRSLIEDIAGSTLIGAVVILAAWAALSIAWSPAPMLAAERLGGVLASPALAFAALVALPDRVRASNLYLVPIGVAAAALATIALVVSGQAGSAADEDGRIAERGIAALTLLLWPAVGWLRSRGRDLEAALLAATTAVAVVIGPQGASAIALAVGALAFLVATLGGRFGAAVVAGFAALALLGAPLLALAAQGGAIPPLGAWGAYIEADPLRLLTGRGMGELVRLRLLGLLPGVPDTLPVQAWFDLGVVGVLAVAVAVGSLLGGAMRVAERLAPAIAATVATALVLSTAGIGSGQAWWPASLSVAALAFVAAERGQFRTRRPRAGALAAA